MHISLINRDMRDLIVPVALAVPGCSSFLIEHAASVRIESGPKPCIVDIFAGRASAELERRNSFAFTIIMS